MFSKSLALVAFVATALQGQGLAARVAAVGDGTVRLEYAAAAGVCGNGRNNISIRHTDGSRSQHGTFIGRVTSGKTNAKRGRYGSPSMCRAEG